MAKLEFGSLYDLNKDLVEKNEKELTATEIETKKQLLINFINKNLYCYYMLLCHERRDYTIFEYEDKQKTIEKTNELVNILVDECLKNRGEIRGIDLANEAIEIWLSIDGESYCYYLFPYDDAVITV